MKKALFLSIPALLLATSCVDSLSDYNIDPKSPTSVPATSLVSSAELGLARIMTEPSVNLNVFRLYVQYWAETTYYDESIYILNTRQIPRSFWRTLYLGYGSTDPTVAPGVLRNLQEAKNLINANTALAADVKANQLACIEVLSVYAWSVLVDTYGNVPYTEALDYLKPSPKYDDAATIYTDLFARLNAAIGSMKTTSTGLGSADLIYGGSMASWVRFANSLKLRLALTTADVDAARSKTLAEQAAPNVFTSNNNEATFAFLSSPPNTNPLWEQLVQSGREDFVGTDTFINQLKGLSDPRLPAYFDPAPGTTDYVGGVYGDGNALVTFSDPGALLQDPTFPGILASYSEVEFLLAEAVERGFNVGGTAAAHYNAAVTASIEFWGGSAADAQTYLAQSNVAYATAKGTYKQKIGYQKWIALYDQPVQAWTEWRRLDTPVLTPPANAISPIPLRFTYPLEEQNLNAANYTAAATAIGGDKVTTKIFWDKF